MPDSMFDVALQSAGGQIALVTSCDENYPPENIIDGENGTFWMSTGIFPQEIIITFQSLMNIQQISLLSSAVKEVRLERSVQDQPVEFEEMVVKELENNEGHSLQKEEFDVTGTATHVRLTILSGYDHFVSVHRVHIDGTAKM